MLHFEKQSLDQSLRRSCFPYTHQFNSSCYVDDVDVDVDGSALLLQLRAYLYMHRHNKPNLS